LFDDHGFPSRHERKVEVGHSKSRYFTGNSMRNSTSKTVTLAITKSSADLEVVGEGGMFTLHARFKTVSPPFWRPVGSEKGRDFLPAGCHRRVELIFFNLMPLFHRIRFRLGEFFVNDSILAERSPRDSVDFRLGEFGAKPGVMTDQKNFLGAGEDTLERVRPSGEGIFLVRRTDYWERAG